MIGYIKSHWAGEQSLAWSFWINGVLIGFLFGFAVNTVASATQISSISSEIVLWLFIVISSFGVSIWSWVGIWRSAKHSIERSRRSVPKKSAFWAYAAMVSVIWGVFQTAAVWWPIIADFKTAYDFSKTELFTEFEIKYQGETDVILIGFINEPSVDAVKNAFLEDERRTALQLVSPGGLLFYAFDLADFIENRAILVVARGHCESACLLALAASPEAYATPDTKLIFHHPEEGVDFVSEQFAIEFSKNVDEYYERFERYGVPLETLADLRKQGRAEMSIGDAYNASIVDVLWEPTSNKFYNLPELCKEVDCFQSPLVLP